MTGTSLTWEQLAELTDFKIDPINGSTNPQSTLRLFGQTEADVRVTLFRDNHAWCPYCQKIDCLCYPLIHRLLAIYKHNTTTALRKK